ncbi:MAG: hypothetical protein AAF591_12385 [Verrucomicrobiota bacterium]
MNHRRFPRYHLTAALLGALLALPAARAEMREFTDPNGNTMTAEIVSASGDTVSMKRSDGKTFTTKVTVFSQDDQDYIKQWIEDEQSNRTPRVDIDVNTGKSNREAQDDYDDRIQSFEFTAKITNTERGFDIVGAKGILLVFGKDVNNSNNLKVLNRQEFDVDVPFSRTLTFTGKPFKNEYDDIAYKHGHKYNGYLLILQNKDGRTIATKAAPDSFAKYHTSAVNLKEGELCNRALIGESADDAGGSVTVQ